VPMPLPMLLPQVLLPHNSCTAHPLDRDLRLYMLMPTHAPWTPFCS